MSSADVRVLTFQKSYPEPAWRQFKADPELMESCVRGDVRQHIADALARDSLVTFTLAEPGEDSGFPVNMNAGVVRASVAVVVKEEISRLALDLAEAEERGFQAALAAIGENIEAYLPQYGDAAHARGMVDALIRLITRQRAHSPVASWRPMRTCKRGPGLEYLFMNGRVSRRPRIVEPRPLPSTVADFTSRDVTSVSMDELDAIAWRAAGRDPVSYQP
jgi:hypothetical protein